MKQMSLNDESVTLRQNVESHMSLFCKAMEDIKSGKDYFPFAESYLNELLDSFRNGVSERQILISFAKWTNGLKVGDINTNLSLLADKFHEVLEARDEHDIPSMIEGLADVVICCYGISQRYGIDFDRVIQDRIKRDINNDKAKY